MPRKTTIRLFNPHVVGYNILKIHRKEVLVGWEITRAFIYWWDGINRSITVEHNLAFLIKGKVSNFIAGFKPWEKVCPCTPWAMHENANISIVTDLKNEKGTVHQAADCCCSPP